MLKGILCLILLCGCGGLGILKAQTYRQRLEELTDLQEMIGMIQTEMQYRKDPLPIVFGRISSYKDNRAMELLWDCSLTMKDSLDIRQCWESSMEYAYQGSCLKQEELAFVLDLGLQLGKSDIQGQAAMFALMKTKLETQIQEAWKEKETKGKMYRGLGFSIGIVIVILLV